MVFETTTVIITPACIALYKLYKRVRRVVVCTLGTISGEAVFIPTQDWFCLLILHVFIYTACELKKYLLKFNGEIEIVREMFP